MNVKLLEKKTVKSVINYLRKFDHNLLPISLDSTAKTAIDAAKSLNVEVGAIVKSLVFKSLKKKYYLCLVSGDKFISLKKLSFIIKDEIVKATAHEVKNQTGYSIGGIPPVAHLSPPTKTFIDLDLKRFDNIYAAAGHPYIVFEITFDKLCELSKGKQENITE